LCHRFHGLDAVRAAALLLGVVLHTAVGFFPDNNPTLAARHLADPLPFVLGFHYIHIFRMASFFLIAGFFGRLLLERRGAGGFIRNRLERILLPLVLGWPVFYPMIAFVTIWQARVRGAAEVSLWYATLSAFTSGKVFRAGFPLGDFWFLYYLLLMYALVLCLRWMFGRWSAAVFKKVIESWWGTIGIAIPLTAVLYRMPRSLGLRTPYGLTIDQSVALAYFIFFLIGWFLFQQPELLGILERRSLRYATFGIAVGTWPLALLARTAGHGGGRLPAIEELSNNAAYSLAMVLMTFGFIGIFLRWMPAPHPKIRYLSDSAYWIYLAHYPLVRALQVGLSPWHVPSSIKIPLIVLSSLAILLLSYHFLVRFSWVGAMLSGPETLADARGSADLFIAEGGDGVNARGAQGRQVSGQQSRGEQTGGKGNPDLWIELHHVEEHVRHEASEHQRKRDAAR
jgi:hypothetical protein